MANVRTHVAAVRTITTDVFYCEREMSEKKMH